MLTLFALALVPSASAQATGDASAATGTATAASDTGVATDTTDTTGTDGSLDVDPEYIRYLGQLDEIAALDIGTGPQPQLWDGMVGLLDFKGNTRGTIFVGGGANPKQEQWFMPNQMHPGQLFGFEHRGWYQPGTEPQILDGIDNDWDVHGCFNQWAKYTEQPNAQLTANLDYTEGIERYHFELWQDGELVGRLLREHHQVPKTPEKFVDHWAFYDGFVFPAKVGEQLWALPAASYDTTTEFFDDLHLDNPNWDSFAQIQYRRQPGFQCFAQISF